jgi:hypothetical protein
VDRDRLTEAELAERAGIDLERLRELVDLGIVRSDGGTFARSDVMRARVVTALEAKGIDRRDVAAAARSGHLSLGYLESAGRRFPRSDRTFQQFATELGVPLET